jgi:hypothetical protein
MSWKPFAQSSAVVGQKRRSRRWASDLGGLSKLSTLRFHLPEPDLGRSHLTSVGALTRFSLCPAYGRRDDPLVPALISRLLTR